MNESNIINNEIFIAKEAFRNMITHILRFGHESLEKKYETIGYCLGNKNEDGNEKIINAIPISHGHDIHIGMSQSYIDLIKKIEENYKEQNLEIKGWYISHPSNGLEWRSQDIQSHLCIQNNKKPKAFCIVCDPTLLDSENNFGFKIYRLLDYKKADFDKYETINYKIELPNTLEYFKWIQKFAEDFYKNNPILIKEIEEISEIKPKDLQEIPIIEEETIEKDSSFQDKLQKASTSFLNNVSDLIEGDISNWMEDISNNCLNGNYKLLEILIQMEENISSGMVKIKTWFNKEIGDLTNIFRESISNSIDQRIESQKEFINNLNNKQKQMLNDIVEMIKENSENYSEQFGQTINKINEKVSNLQNINITNKEKFQKLSEMHLKLENNIREMSEKISIKIKETIDEKRTENTNQINLLNTEINNIESAYSEMDEKLKKLEDHLSILRKL